MAKLATLFLLTLSIQSMASQFVQLNFLNTILNNGPEVELKNPPLPDRCLPTDDTSSCIKSVCSRMPSYKCDDLSELQNVAKVCKNNFNGQCVDFSCGKMAGFKCDEIEEIGLIASSCQFVYGNACQYLYTSRIPNFKADDVDEWVAINSSCRMASADAVKCAEFTCSKLGTFKCDDPEEIRDVLSACISL